MIRQRRSSDGAVAKGMRVAPPLLLLLALSTCTETPRFSHEPTADFRTTYDLSQPKLAPFSAAGVLTLPALIQGRPWVQLAFYSKQDASMRIRSVKLSGVGAAASRSKELELDVTVPILKQSTAPGVRSAGTTIQLDIDGEEFDTIGAEGYLLTLDVSATGGGLTEDKRMVFGITRRVVVIPTCGGW